MPRTTDFTGYDEICIEFLSSQNKGTQHTYKSFLRHILKFTGLTGQQILDSKRNDKNYEWEKKVIAFKQWMKTQKTKQGNFYSDNATNTAVNTLRSFFDYYRTPLVFSQNENRKLNGKAKRVSKDYMLTNDDISKMVMVGNLREKYLVLLGKSFGLRAGDFITFTYGTFRSLNLDQEPPIFIGEFQTEKEGVTAFPFIDSDALPIIKIILEGNRDKPNNERVITVQDEELSSILQALAVKANINLGDQHLRFHCFRKYLSDRLSANMSESKWKQIVGKAISEGAYISSFELRDSYLKTMKLTTVSSNGNGKVSKLSEELTELNNKINKQNAIIDALFQNSTKKDLELEKQSQEIKKIRDQLEEINHRINPPAPIVREISWEEGLREIKEHEKWLETHPEEAKEEQESEEFFQQQVEEEHKETEVLQKLTKEDPESWTRFLINQTLELKNLKRDMQYLRKRYEEAKE